MDITDALAPASDQLDAVELVNPRTFTIDTGSRLGSREGKTVAEVRLVDFPRVWRPSKGMLDVLALCWGTDGKQWVGRRVTVYNDTEVMFGREKTGGVRISHLSHIDKARDLTIRAPGQGKKQRWHVDPLPDAEPTKPARKAAEPTPDVASITDRDVLTRMWKAAPRDSAERAAIEARVAELTTKPAEPDTGPGPSDADWDAMGAPDDAADGDLA